MAELEVWLHSQQVGVLAMNAGVLSFQYLPNWLE